MIFNLKKSSLFIVSVAGLLSAGTAKGQLSVSDSLSLKSIISEVVQNHPAVKKAEENLNISDAKIGIAKSANLPNVDFSTSYSRIGPIDEISLPGLGSFSLMPHDNYSAGINANQILYDFGKTEKNILLEKQGKELSTQSIEQVKQKLSQAAIGNYFSLVYLQEAVKIKEEQLNTLNEHLRYIQKKVETGSATQYEILITQVKISTIENQKTDLQTALQVQVCQLNSLLGKPESTSEQVKNELNIGLPDLQNDSLISAAIQNRDEMKLARQKAKLADLRYKLTNSQNNPVFNAFLSGGVKNGYIPYMNDPKANFVAGIGLKIPVFDGKRKEFNLVQSQSAIQVNFQETEILRRGIVEDVVEAEANVKASQKKIDQSELQLRQAMQAYSLAKVRFESGVITNLELIEGSTAVSESRLTVLKSRIDYTVNIYKLKSAIGERLY
ncbi:MAG TPA: TolC family protein [Prolixibacteraceae bacterium]|nr:TolC family protein [Prolixibacteraceae bacterium]